MKKLIALSAIFFAVVLTSNVFAQNTANTSAEASATIILPISIEKTQDLYFGTIASTNAAGWVTLNPTTGDVTSEFTNQLTTLTEPTYATFTVEGEKDALFSITLPANGEVSLDGNGTDIPVVDFTTDITDPISSLTLPENGYTFNVGATLNVNANQAAGEYNGSFTVKVDYN